MHHRSRLLFCALLASATTGSIGCTGDRSEFPEGAQSVLIQPIPEAQPERSYSGITTQQRLVVRDGATWANVWQQIAGNSIPVPAVPAVDFASHVVIVAAMGMKNSGGYSIDVNDVRTLAEDAWISITENSPGAMCITTAVITTPVAIVRVPRFAGQVTFLEHAVQNDCR